MRQLDLFSAVAWPCVFSLAVLRRTASALAPDAEGFAAVQDAEIQLRSPELEAVSDVIAMRNHDGDGLANANVAVKADGSLMLVRQQLVHSHQTSQEIAPEEDVELHQGASFYGDTETRSRAVIGADGSMNGEAHLAIEADDDPERDPAARPQQGESHLLQASAWGRPLTALGYSLLHTNMYASNAGVAVAIGLTIGVLLSVGCVVMFIFYRRKQAQEMSVGFALQGDDKEGNGTEFDGTGTVALSKKRRTQQSKKLMDDYKVGESVEVLTKDQEWVQCRVASVKPDRSVVVDYMGTERVILAQELATSHILRCPKTQKQKTMVNCKLDDSVEMLANDVWYLGRVAAVQPDQSVKVVMVKVNPIGKQKLIPEQELAIVLRHSAQDDADQDVAEDKELEVGQVVEVLSGTHGWVQARISKIDKDGFTVDYIGYDLQRTVDALDKQRMRRVQAEGPKVGKETITHVLNTLEIALRVDAPGILAEKGWFLPLNKLMERTDMRNIKNTHVRTVVATFETGSGQRLFHMRDGLFGAELRSHETVVLAKLEYHACGVDDDLDWELEKRLGVLGKGALKGHTLTRTGKGEYDIDDCVATHISLETDDKGEIFVLHGTEKEWHSTLGEYLQQLEPAQQPRLRVLTDKEFAQRGEAQARRSRMNQL